MFCSNCGKEVMNGAKFCDNCGQAVLKNTDVFDERKIVYEPQKSKEANQLLNNFLKRITINSIFWLVIGIDQLLTAGLRFFSLTTDNPKNELFLLILGISNVFFGIGTICSRKEILEKPMGIVAEHKISGGLFVEYIWNIAIGLLCLFSEDYFFFGLAFAAVMTDIFLVKLYVMSHKQAFLELEEKYRVEAEEKYREETEILKQAIGSNAEMPKVRNPREVHFSDELYKDNVVLKTSEPFSTEIQNINWVSFVSMLIVFGLTIKGGIAGAAFLSLLAGFALWLLVRTVAVLIYKAKYNKIPFYLPYEMTIQEFEIMARRAWNPTETLIETDQETGMMEVIYKGLVFEFIRQGDVFQVRWRVAGAKALARNVDFVYMNRAISSISYLVYQIQQDSKTIWIVGCIIQILQENTKKQKLSCQRFFAVAW